MKNGSNKRPYRGVKRFFVFASGAQPDILKSCPTEESTYVGLGGTVISTALLGGISMTFALSIAFGVNWTVTLGAGLLWGVIIFNLDRWLVSSTRRMRTFRLQFLSALPRIALAVLFGIVISEPLILKIFEPEIERQMVEDVNAAQDEAAEKRTSGSKATELKGNDAKISKLEQVEASETAGVAPLLSERDALEKEITEAEDALRTAQLEVTKEVEGLSATGKSGCGGACLVKTQDRDQKAQAVQDVKGRNEPKIGALTSQIDALRRDGNEAEQAATAARRAEITKLRATSDRLNAQIEEEYDAVIAEKDTGLLAQISALGNLGDKDPTISHVHLALMLLFVAIDVLPVFGKLMSTIGPKNFYETLQEAVESQVDEQAGHMVEEAQHTRSHQNELLEADARLRQSAEEDNVRHFVEEAAAVQRQLGDELLARWRREQLGRLNGASNGRRSASGESQQRVANPDVRSNGQRGAPNGESGPQDPPQGTTGTDVSPGPEIGVEVDLRGTNPAKDTHHSQDSGSSQPPPTRRRRPGGPLLQEAEQPEAGSSRVGPANGDGRPRSNA